VGNKYLHGLDGRKGLHVLGYALAAMKSGKITPRQTVLLTLLDYHVNSIRFRTPNHKQQPEWPRPQWVEVGFAELRSALRCEDNKGVYRCCKNLRSAKLLKFKRIGGRSWSAGLRLAVRWRDGEKAVMRIDCRDFREFQEGRFSPTELFVYSYAASFFRSGKACYVTNKTIGKALGFGEQNAQKCIARLVEKGYLTRRIMKHDELHVWLDERDLADGFRRRGGRNSRVLMPTNGDFRVGKEPESEEEFEEFDDDLSPE